MMTYEEVTELGNVIKIHWRIECYSDDEILENPELKLKQRLRFTKNINNIHRHIIRTMDTDITISEMQILCKRVASLDDGFWR